MRTLLEIEEAISRLPAESQAQLIKDIPALCPDAFRRDGWEEILGNGAPRAGFSELLDQVDAEYRQAPERFPVLNEDRLGDNP